MTTILYTCRSQWDKGVDVTILSVCGVCGVGCVVCRGGYVVCWGCGFCVSVCGVFDIGICGWCLCVCLYVWHAVLVCIHSYPICTHTSCSVLNIPSYLSLLIKYYPAVFAWLWWEEKIIAVRILEYWRQTWQVNSTLPPLPITSPLAW